MFSGERKAQENGWYLLFGVSIGVLVGIFSYYFSYWYEGVYYNNEGPEYVRFPLMVFLIPIIFVFARLFEALFGLAGCTLRGQYNVVFIGFTYTSPIAFLALNSYLYIVTLLLINPIFIHFLIRDYGDKIILKLFKSRPMQYVIVLFLCICTITIIKMYQQAIFREKVDKIIYKQYDELKKGLNSNNLDYSKLISQLNEVLELDGVRFVPNLLLGDLYYISGDKDKAYDNYLICNFKIDQFPYSDIWHTKNDYGPLLEIKKQIECRMSLIKYSDKGSIELLKSKCEFPFTGI